MNTKLKMKMKTNRTVEMKVKMKVGMWMRVMMKMTVEQGQQKFMVIEIVGSSLFIYSAGNLRSAKFIFNIGHRITDVHLLQHSVFNTIGKLAPNVIAAIGNKLDRFGELT